MKAQVKILCTLLFVGIFVGIFFIATTELKNIFSTKKITANQMFENFWSDRISHDGKDKAYELFKKHYHTESITQKHRAAHLFGGALYNTVGLNALSTCDLDYSSGCFHEFIGRAIIFEGIEIVHTIDEYCKAKFDCQHGVGHGLLGYFGYEEESLQQALEVCNDIKSVDPRDGCFGGIFMEYNMRNMLIGENFPIRLQSELAKPDEVCSNVPNYAGSACYFWLAQWLLFRNQYSQIEQIQYAARMCSEVEAIEDRLDCYSGLANDLTSYTHDVDTLRGYCEYAVVKNKDEFFEVQCKTGVAVSLFADLETRPSAPDMCLGLDGERHTFCIFYATKSDGKRVLPFVESERVTNALR